VRKLTEGVYWVGSNDWNLRHFHGHEISVHRGSTYNAYLVKDEKTVLVDTVWEPFAEQLIENIKAVTDIGQIDYVIANHAEPDHSGALPAIMELAPEATVVVSRRGEESIKRHYHQDWKLKVVKTGDRLNIGSSDLVFVEASMLHWPDSMFTYLTGKNILFSNDAFGQHYAASGLFNDEADSTEIMQEAVKYYANILTPFSRLVARKIDELKGMELPVEIIAPSHGIIWRQDPLQIVDKYYEWATGPAVQGAVIAYSTMWGATAKLAEAIAQGLTEAGTDYKLFNVAVSDKSDILTQIFLSRGLLLGSSTINGLTLPTLAPLLEDIRGLKFRDKVGAAFGSYGWSGEGVAILEDNLQKANIRVIQAGIQYKYRANENELAECVAFGRSFGEKLRADS
jgi:anaerobic nitric oxide reductase flavorubredoxin